MLQIYNTKTRKKEDFKPLSSRETKVYYCGPTPYNFAHVGNLKAYLGNDMIVRTLRFLGHEVKTTMNVTDIDDKTIRDSQAAWESLLDFTKKYTDIFLQDLEKLSIIPADIVSPISEIIPEMVRMINTLLRRWFAYVADDGSVYYNIKKFKKYGQLAHLDMKWMKSSVRIDNDEYDKENVADFALWKAWSETDGENSWDAEFELPPLNPLLTKEGKTNESESGVVIIKWRPGWHIECSACAMKHLGPQIDLHMGGIDNLFPHHQNEVAQTEACTRKEFSKYWAHHGHLTVDGKKMSKSADNFYTLADLEAKQISWEIPAKTAEMLYRALRLNFLSGTYRDQIDLSFDKLTANINTLTGLDETIKNISYQLSGIEHALSWVSREFRDYTQDIIGRYIEALEDDFAIPETLVVVFEFQKFVNSNIADATLSGEEIQSCLDMFQTFNEVLGVLKFDFASGEISAEILEKLAQRDAAKASKAFEAADRLRDEISAAGYKIIDSREGSRLELI